MGFSTSIGHRSCRMSTAWLSSSVFVVAMLLCCFPGLNSLVGERAACPDIERRPASTSQITSPGIPCWPTVQTTEAQGSDSCLRHNAQPLRCGKHRLMASFRVLGSTFRTIDCAIDGQVQIEEKIIHAIRLSIKSGVQVPSAQFCCFDLRLKGWIPSRLSS